MKKIPPFATATTIDTHKKHTGFTLMELMIVLALIAILSMIALPQYMNYVTRSHRSVGLNVLQANILAIEQFRSQTGNYPTAGQVNGGNVIGYLNTSEQQSARFYTYRYALNNANTATVTMTAANVNGASTDLDCTTLTLNTNGTQTALDNNNQDNAAICWQNR